jgi:hypothetical protein
MPLLTELENILDRCFYKYAAPTALGLPKPSLQASLKDDSAYAMLNAYPGVSGAKS